MSRGGHDGVSSFLRNFAGAYAIGDRVATDVGLSRAANISPETIETSRAVETTQGTEGMIRDSETGNYVPRMFDETGQLTEHGLTQSNSAGLEPVKIVEPTYQTETKRQYRLGDQEQDTPFSQEQIDAKRFRAQADVYSRLGEPKKAAELQGLAKTRNEEDATNKIRAGGTEGIKNSKDLRDEEKMYATTKGMYETALKLNRPDLATGYYNQMNQARDALLAQSNERAERVYRSTGGNISGFVDTYNQ